MLTESYHHLKFEKLIFARGKFSQPGFGKATSQMEVLYLKYKLIIYC